MDWMSTLQDVIQRYSGQAGGAAAAPENPHGDFQQVAQAAPQGEVADGLSQAFRSDQTPPFSEMVANLFSRSDPNQRAALLNRMLDAAGPGMISALPSLGGLASLLGGGSVTPEQASQISPVQVQQMAADAERQNPSVIDEVSSFYSQHPQLVNALGGAAITIALRHILKRQ
jgi:hypothetical protein